MQNKKLIICFITLFFFTMMFSFNSVNAAEGDVPLADWDDISSGLDSGTSGYIDFENTGIANYFETSTAHDLSAPNSFKLQNYRDTVDHWFSGWWNLTDSFDYMGSINFSFVFTATGVGISDSYIKFYLGGVEQIRLFFDYSAKDIKFYDNSITDYRPVYESFVKDARYYVVISHNLTNNFVVTVYNSTFDVQGTVDSAGVSTDVWASFDDIYLYGTSALGGYEYDILYIDDIIINQESAAGEGGGDDEFPGLILDKPECGLLGSMPVMRYYEWFGNVRDTKETTHHWFYTSEIPHILEIQQNKWRTTTIYYVDLFVSNTQYDQISSNGNDYSCRVNNNPFTFVSFIPKTIDGVSGYLMRFAGSAVLTDDPPLFCFKSSESYDTVTYGEQIHWDLPVLYSTCNYFAGKHHTEGDYTDNQHDGVLFNNPSAEFEGWYFVTGHVSPYVQYWYDGGNMSSTVEPIPDIEKENFTLKYGDSAIEFKHLGYCDYGIGSHPTIRFHLNSTQVNLYDKYYYQVVKQSNEEVVMTGFINFVGGANEIWGDIYLQEKFTSIGVYYIALWNLTTNVQLDQVVMLSQDTVIVCQTGYVGLEDDDDGIDTSGTGSIDDAIKSLPVYAKVIAALFIIILLTMSPYAITVMISKTNIHVEIPSLLYVAFFFTGVIACVMLSLLEIYVFFIVLIGLIIAFAILWVQGKSIGGGEE